MLSWKLSSSNCTGVDSAPVEVSSGRTVMSYIGLPPSVVPTGSGSAAKLLSVAVASVAVSTTCSVASGAVASVVSSASANTGIAAIIEAIITEVIFFIYDTSFPCLYRPCLPGADIL